MVATTPGSLARTKKPLTYGKRNSPATFTGDLSFFDNDASSPESTIKKAAAPRSTYKPAQTPGSRLVSKQSPRAPATVQTPSLSRPAKDEFDVPSSDEDVAVERKLFTKTALKRRLVDAHAESDHFTGDKKVRLEAGARKNVTFAASEAPLQHGMTLAMHQKAPTRSPKSSATKVVLDEEAMRGMTAVEKLRYRKQQLNGNSVFEPDSSSPASSSDVAARKRPRQQTNARQQRSAPIQHDSVMANSDIPGPIVQPTNLSNSISSLRRVRIPSPRSSPVRDLQSPGEMTPRQKRLWNGLFDDMIDESATSIDSSLQHTPNISRSATRNRLVDRLKDQQEPMDISDSESMTSTSQQSEPEVQPAATPRRAPASAVPRSRITYSTEQRSLLDDDSLEDGLFSGLGNMSQTQATGTMLDFEDEEELESGVAKIRSVHELRAQGKASRLTATIEDALQEVTNKATTLFKRATALVKLAEKLKSQDFAKTFVHAGHDVKLLEAAALFKDDTMRSVAVFASTSLMQTDLTQHSLQAIKQLLLVCTDLLKQRSSMLDVVRASKSLVRLQASVGTLLSDRKLSAPDFGLSPRVASLEAWDKLLRLLQHDAQASALGDDTLLLICPNDSFQTSATSTHESGLVISILESLSTSSSTTEWPPALVATIASLPMAIEVGTAFDQHTKFLAYRLCLNITNNKLLDHFMFTRAGSMPSLLRSIVDGFERLTNDTQDSEQKPLQLDYLILALGIVINLSEYSQAARRAMSGDEETALLGTLVSVFKAGVDRAALAESEEQSSSNVAAGYLSVMLASFCQEPALMKVIRKDLGDQLATLVTAVQEFIRHHQKVDTAHFEGAEGHEIWTTFTNRLKSVLNRLERQA